MDERIDLTENRMFRKNEIKKSLSNLAFLESALGLIMKNKPKESERMPWFFDDKDECGWNKVIITGNAEYVKEKLKRRDGCVECGMDVVFTDFFSTQEKICKDCLFMYGAYDDQMTYFNYHPIKGFREEELREPFWLGV